MQPGQRFPALDGYRAIAAVTVVVFHVLYLTGQNVAGTGIGNIASRLDVAVTLFFLLSGFLLYRPWAAAHLAPAPAQRGPRTAGYLWHRALRILPAYWVLCLVALLTTARGGGAGSWVRTLTLTEVYHRALPLGLEQTWSLSAEVVFYLLLPVFAALLLRPRRRAPRRQLRLEVCVLVLLAVFGVVCQGFAESRLPWVPKLLGSWLPGYLAWFAAGMTMAVVHSWTSAHPGRLRTLVTEIGANWVLCWTSAALLFALAMTPVAGSHASATLTSFEAMSRNVLYCLMATAFLIPGIFGPQRDGFVMRMMNAPAMAYLGLISYGIFLWHLILAKPVITLTGHQLFQGGTLEVLAVTLLASVGVASLSYYLIEEPALRLKSRGPSIRRSEPSAGLGPHDPDVRVGVEAQT